MHRKRATSSFDDLSYSSKEDLRFDHRWFVLVFRGFGRGRNETRVSLALQSIEVSHGGSVRRRICVGFVVVGSPRSVASEIKNQSLSSSKRRRGCALKPLLGKPLMASKKILQTEAKSEEGMEKKKKKMMDLGGGVTNNKGLLRNGLVQDHHHRQKANEIWRKHVWVVLMFDVCICVVLFGVWLWVCHGFQCIQG